MSRKYNNNYGNNRNNCKGKKSKSKFTDLEKLAFDLGKIQAGLKEDTKVKESYENGLNSKNKEKKKRKPLF